MTMAEWWAARTGISRHPKTYRLAEALGVDDAAGLGYMVRLYDFAAAYRERGDLSGLSSREIARGCGWSGDPQVFLAALRTAGLMDENKVHDWLEQQGPYLAKRDAARERMKQYREKNSSRTVREQPREQNATRSPDLPTDLPTDLQTKRKNVSSVTSPSDITKPPTDIAFSFDCQGSPPVWHLTETQITAWQAVYPSLDVRAECRKAQAWTDTGRRKTAKGMTRFLVSWLNRSADRPASGTNGHPQGPIPLTPQREREIRLKKLREDLACYREMEKPIAIKQAEDAIRKLGAEP